MNRTLLFLSTIGLATAIGCSSSPTPAQDDDPPPPGPKRLFVIDDDNGFDRVAVDRDGAYPAPAGVHVPFTDPDGGLELFYALRDPSVTLVGVTCSYGVVSEPICEEAVHHILAKAGREDVPVYAGAAGAADFGVRTPAVDFLIKVILEHPGEIEIVSSGPFTNLATALELEPSIKDKWKTLHVLSGEFQMGSDVQRFSAAIGGDMNLSIDYPATQYMFDNGGPFPMYTNELQGSVVFTNDERQTLLDSSSAVAQFVAYEIQPWSTVMNLVMGVGGFYPHGMTGIAPVFDPTLTTAEYTAPIRLVMVGPPANRNSWGQFVTRRDDTAPGAAHPVYMRMMNPALFHKRYMRRLQ